jgi:hypothetical protein
MMLMIEHLLRTNKREMLLAVELLVQTCLLIVVSGQYESVQAWNTNAMDRWISRALRQNIEVTGIQNVGIHLERHWDHGLCNSKHTKTIPKEYSRRKMMVASISILSSSTILQTSLMPSLARNLPASTGADTSKSGSLQTLLPILKLRNTLKDLRRSLQEEHDISANANPTSSTSILTIIPKKELQFKRIFDEYSDQVSYKQNFLDQNAFLVYYTQGYDGPGRKKMEEDIVNERQTLQFGARNEAWVAWEGFLAEQEYYQKTHSGLSTTTGKSRQEEEEEKEDFAHLIQCLSETILAIDTYLKLAPQQDIVAIEALLTSDSL